MGSRGPLPAKRGPSPRTAAGVALRRLPSEADAIFRRLAKDIVGLTPADVAIVEDTARWVSVAKNAYAQLLADDEPEANQLLADDEPEAKRKNGVGAYAKQEIEMALTVTDTAHGNKEESRKNPLLIVMRTASEQIRANVQQLGATPLSRARIPEPEHEQLSLADILFSDVPANHE